jgi:steroid delta-isomerase-like uncharacterized protein
MSALEENKNLVRLWINARNNNDLENALKVWSSNWHDVLKKNFPAVTHIFPDIHITIEEMIAEGDKVVAYTTLHGTHSSTFLGVEATGKTVAIPHIDIYHVEDGKLLGITRVIDGLEALNQMGVSFEKELKKVT